MFRHISELINLRYNTMPKAQMSVSGEVLGEKMSEPYTDKATGKTSEPKRQLKLIQDGGEDVLLITIPADYKVEKGKKVVLSVSQWSPKRPSFTLIA